jgi:hypothetical protein
MWSCLLLTQADISREMCGVCFCWKSARRGIGSARVRRKRKATNRTLAIQDQITAVDDHVVGIHS